MGDQFVIPELDRVLFFSGQLLETEDLTDLETSDRELRWLHNRSLHGWGIGAGFAVTGKSGDREVFVHPGYAVDRRGREIILTETRSKVVPAVTGGAGEAIYMLTARYQPDAAQKVRERRSGICHPGGNIRLSEEPAIEWKQAKDLKLGLDIVLATVFIRNCQLSRDASAKGRRYARPAQRPYIAAGQTAAAATAWQAWEASGQFLGFTAQVDTASARFASTPHYVAHLAGERYLQSPTPLIAMGMPAVTAASPEGFELRVLVPEGPKGTIVNPKELRHPKIGLEIVRQLDWHVIWMGAEA